MTFRFLHEKDGSLGLSSAVFQALGAASVCWDENKVFMSERAEEIGHALIDFIKKSGPLTFARVTEVNTLRGGRWHPGFPHNDEDGPPSDWSGADWSNAMCGEAGEAANVVKKIRRWETGAANAGDPTLDDLLHMLGHEIADVFLYLNLLATYYGIDMEAAIVAKFDIVSEKQGFPERLGS